MKLSNLLAIGGGLLGAATADNWAEGLASGAAIVAGVAGEMGNSNLQKIAGVTSLGAGAYDLFSGGPSSADAAKDASKSGIADALASDRGNQATGPSATGQSFGDASYDASKGMAASWKADALTPTPVATTSTGNLVDAARSATSGVGGFLRDNKELVQLGGSVLNGMFGPQATQANLIKMKIEADEREKQRRIANANNVSGLRVPVTSGSY